MATERRLKVLEFVLWVAAASAVTVLAGIALGFLVGGTLRAGKLVLFVVGFLLFGVGSVAIQPSGPDLSGSVFDGDREPSRRSLDPLGGGPGAGGESGVLDADEDAGTDQNRFEARLQEVGPLAEADLPPERRVSRGVKVFATSIVVLAASFLMEVAGVQV